MEIRDSITNPTMRQVQHLSHYKQFGNSPSVTVGVYDTRDHLTSENGVEINWSCVGSVSVEHAMTFKNNLADAIAYAYDCREKLRLSHGVDSTTAST